jgi:hypothetical protein
MIEVLLTLQESEPEYYKDETIKDLMVVRSLSSNSENWVALNFTFQRQSTKKKRGGGGGLVV